MVKCGYCGADAEFVDGETVYPHRPDLSKKSFYLCRPCKAWVGCHQGTTTPLGRLANEYLRKAKMKAHAAFDPIWKNKNKSRKKAYEWLASKLGIQVDDCHIGDFDEETCKRVVEICSKTGAG